MEFQLVLHVLWFRQAAVSHLAYVLVAVNDAQMARAILNEARVPGGDPALGILGRCGALGVPAVHDKDAGESGMRLRRSRRS